MSILNRSLLHALVLCVAITASAAADKAAQIDALMQKYAALDHFNGSVLAAEGGTVIFKKGYGKANLEWDIPNAADTQEELNLLGYQLLQAGKTDDAIAVFKLNVEAFPDGFNAYDSLGEAYMTAGKKENAIKNYAKSLELNPDNTNALDQLNALMKAKQSGTGILACPFCICSVLTLVRTAFGMGNVAQPPPAVSVTRWDHSARGPNPLSPLFLSLSCQTPIRHPQNDLLRTCIGQPDHDCCLSLI